MNFASLLKHHESRGYNLTNGNQFTVNCNRKVQSGHPII